MAVKKKPAAKGPATRKKAPAKKPAARKKSPRTRKPAFGGYALSFAGRKETMEQVFGKKPIPPSEMMKKVWAFIRSNNLSNK